MKRFENLVPSQFTELNERSREIFRLIVDGYVQTGEPIGSRTLSRLLGQILSPATIRNVMADLEDAGLLFSPHTSAGRLPTEAGLRLFVHGLLEVAAENATATGRRIDDAQARATLERIAGSVSSSSKLGKLAGTLLAG